MAEAEQSSSEQAMGSAFEQALWVLFDGLVPQLQGDLAERRRPAPPPYQFE